MRNQHVREIRVKAAIVDSRQNLTQLAHHPALTAIEEGDALLKIGYGPSLFHKTRRSLSPGFQVASQHGGPARFVALDGPHQFRNRPASCRACTLERHPRSGAGRLELRIEPSGMADAARLDNRSGTTGLTPGLFQSGSATSK
jgi:hypothetical protein